MFIINLIIKWLTLLVTNKAYVSFCQHSFVAPLENSKVAQRVLVLYGASQVCSRTKAVQ
jgi:hypothetical protein